MYTFISSHSLSLSLSPTRTNTSTRTHTHSHTHIHTQAHARTHTNTHAHALANTHATHTHTYTHVSTHEKELKFTVYSIFQDQDTPLHLAAGNGHSGTVQVLVEAKADVAAGNQVCMCGRGRGWMDSWGGRLCHE